MKEIDEQEKDSYVIDKLMSTNQMGYRVPALVLPPPPPFSLPTYYNDYVTVLLSF